jgi:hypothetical protein
MLAAARTATSATVMVPADQTWTDTGIALTANEQVAISATGTIEYGHGNYPSGPAGFSFADHNRAGTGATCGYSAYAPGTPPFPAPGVNCEAMLLRIGTSGVAFPTGTKISFASPVSGELYLGINDNIVSDNSGSWTATITTG